MNTEDQVQEVGPADEAVQKRRVTRYTARERAELLKAYDESGEGQDAFCVARRVNAGTFKGWLSKRGKRSTPGFAKMEIPVGGAAPIEILLGNGVRVGLQHQGSREELVALIRGVAGC